MQSQGILLNFMSENYVNIYLLKFHVLAICVIYVLQNILNVLTTFVLAIHAFMYVVFLRIFQ